jgi:hypothetical protein
MEIISLNFSLTGQSQSHNQKYPSVKKHGRCGVRVSLRTTSIFRLKEFERHKHME